MKIAILTMFKDFRCTYSLVNVVMTHIEMIIGSGNEVMLIVSKGCKDREKYKILQDKNLEWIEIDEVYNGKKILRKNYYDDEVDWNDSNEEEVRYLADEFSNVLKDVNLCLLNDILFQSSYYIYNRAIRMVEKEFSSREDRDLHFIEFTHSFPFDRPKILNPREEYRFTNMPNTLYAYPTRSGITALANQYNIPEGKCHVMYHPSTIVSDMNDEVRDIYSKVDFMSPDILIIYPSRLTTGKQFEGVVKLGGAISLMGELSVKIIFCDFNSKDTDGTEYINTIKLAGINYGLDANDIIFTSQLGYKDGVSHETILELFELSNIYICPSKSESFSLTLLEAARKGNFLIVNENVPALKELGDILGAYFMRWDARVMGHEIVQKYGEAEATYYGFHATKILKKLQNDSTYRAKTKFRQRFNLDWVWKNQFKPLIERALKTYS